jgi:molybdenum cofactor guanylyltransferase
MTHEPGLPDRPDIFAQQRDQQDDQQHAQQRLPVMLPHAGLAAFVLAGGRSTRMGADKAMLQLGGKTLLARAVETLRLVSSHVAVVGLDDEEANALEGADQALADLHPGLGPLGGIEAALRSLESLPGAEWACFLPVDMPLLPATLYAALVRRWLGQAARGLRAGYVVVDGLPQPLVSLLHRSVLPEVTAALDARRLKVTPVLQSVAQSVTYSQAGDRNSGNREVGIVSFLTGNAAGGSSTSPGDRSQAVDEEPPIPGIDWKPTAAEAASKTYWFVNCNTPEEFTRAKTFAGTV